MAVGSSGGRCGVPGRLIQPPKHDVRIGSQGLPPSPGHPREKGNAYLIGFLNLKPEQTNIFFKLMEERYNKKSTIITTNLPYEDWNGFLGNKHMVGALLDRLRHRCHTITIDGPSLRAPTEP